MAEVGTAGAAHDLDPDLVRPMIVQGRLEAFPGHRFPEARPPGPRLELRPAREHLRVAADAVVDADGLVVDVLARVRRLGGLLAGDEILGWRQLLRPLLVRLPEFLRRL